MSDTHSPGTVCRTGSSPLACRLEAGKGRGTLCMYCPDAPQNATLERACWKPYPLAGRPSDQAAAATKEAHRWQAWPQRSAPQPTLAWQRQADGGGRRSSAACHNSDMLRKIGSSLVPPGVAHGRWGMSQRQCVLGGMRTQPLARLWRHSMARGHHGGMLMVLGMQHAASMRCASMQYALHVWCPVNCMLGMGRHCRVGVKAGWQRRCGAPGHRLHVGRAGPLCLL